MDEFKKRLKLENLSAIQIGILIHVMNHIDHFQAIKGKIIMEKCLSTKADKAFNKNFFANRKPGKVKI